MLIYALFKTYIHKIVDILLTNALLCYWAIPEIRGTP